jgi:hypothetical protein
LRVFGVGYFETASEYRHINVTRHVYAPQGDVRARWPMWLTNNRANPVDLRYYEYWDVNIHQLAVQLARTAVFSEIGDANRREINFEFDAAITWMTRRRR